jgi:hypothetical protein
MPYVNVDRPNQNVTEPTLSVTFVEENAPATNSLWFDLPDSIITPVGNPEHVIA